MSDPDLAKSEQSSRFANHIGMTLTSWNPDTARVECSVAPEILNRQGIPHGGVHASLLDTAMGYSGCFTGDSATPQLCVTLNLSVNFVGPVKGTRMIATGTRTVGGKSTFFAEGRLVDDTGVLVATATGVFRYVSRRAKPSS